MSKTHVDKCLIFSGDRCTGCKICEMACSMVKQGEYNPKKSYIRILKNPEMDVSVATLDFRCDFCNRCVAWCPTAAIRFVDYVEAAILRKENKVGMFPAPFVKGSKETGESGE